MVLWLFLNIVFILVINLPSTLSEHFHQTAEQYKLSPGWQEPGLWRPKWIMDRVFDATDDEPEKVDRVLFRLKPDRTMKVLTSAKRPKFELFKKKTEVEKKKKLFETGNEEMLSIEEQWKKSKKIANEDIDGSWWWQEATPKSQGIVKLETRESDDERIRHDIRCDWGKLDGYAALFRRGKLLKYKMTEAGVPLGTYPVGSFTIRVSPHRPIISKEYIAFE